ncbi:MAG: SGNH/GDSL hydrolase family protein [Thermoflexales bacterium]
MYAAASARGRDAAIFTVAGDSNSEWPGYLGQIATGAYDLRARPAYAAATARFAPSFPRRSTAAGGGLRAADMFLADWPDKPSTCERSEGRFACELRLSRAAIIFIQLGTGDRFVWSEYEGHMRRMLDVALQSGVLPVLVTKADDLESWQGGAPIDHMNIVVRRLAAEYQLPMIDFFVATRSLPVIVNPQLPDRPYTKNGLLDEWGYYFHLSDLGKEMRILTTLAMLAAIAN